MMIEFLDGPAMGKTLTLRRGPFFLRIVCNPQGKWDGLDQLKDRPSMAEDVFVYLMCEDRGSVHIRASRRENSGWLQMALYRLCPEQPDLKILRSNVLWQEWAKANVVRMKQWIKDNPHKKVEP